MNHSDPQPGYPAPGPDPQGRREGAAAVGAGRDDAELARWLLAELDQVCDRAGLAVSVLTRRGNPARELAAAADEAGADALVVGAPRHRWHQVAGSVSGWLARHAHCPVIVVP